MVEIEYTKEDEKRFWSKVKLPDMIGTDECWNWQAGKNRIGGYGLFKVNNKMVTAHRLSYLITVGEVSVDLCVCHKCDNPACVNPDHLWLGTIAGNMKDRDQKGRAAPHEGENYGGHKLTNNNIREIRRLYKTGQATLQQIADIFNVSAPQISRIVNYKQWSHIP